MTEHPFREARIDGMTARAVLLVQDPGNLGLRLHPDGPREFMDVRTAADVDKALGDPENQHHCPLCDNEFGTAAFVAHAPQCIAKYAPRYRVWAPPGVKGVIQSYSDERPRRPGSGLYDAY